MTIERHTKAELVVLIKELREENAQLINALAEANTKTDKCHALNEYTQKANYGVLARANEAKAKFVAGRDELTKARERVVIAETQTKHVLGLLDARDKANKSLEEQLAETESRLSGTQSCVSNNTDLMINLLKGLVNKND